MGPNFIKGGISAVSGMVRHRQGRAIEQEVRSPQDPSQLATVERIRSRRTLIRTGAFLAVAGAALVGVKGCDTGLDDLFGSFSAEDAVEPESALSNVELTDRTIIVEGDMTAAATIETEWCAPIIGCNVPGAGRSASYEAEGVLQVVAEEGAITLTSQQDAEGVSYVLATVNNPTDNLTTQVADLRGIPSGDSGFFVDVANAFGASDGRNGLIEMAQTMATESGERACAEALAPVTAEGIGGMVLNELQREAALLESQGETGAAETLRALAEQPIRVDLGVSEEDFDFMVPVTYEEGSYEEDHAGGEARMDIGAEEDCMLTPEAQEQLTAIELAEKVIVVEPLVTTPTPSAN